MKSLAIIFLLGLGGCTLADRNAVAVSLCERSAGCTVSDQREKYGPPQVRAMDNPRQTSATARSKK